MINKSGQVKMQYQYVLFIFHLLSPIYILDEEVKLTSPGDMVFSEKLDSLKKQKIC